MECLQCLCDDIMSVRISLTLIHIDMCHEEIIREEGQEPDGPKTRHRGGGTERPGGKGKGGGRQGRKERKKKKAREGAPNATQ